MWLRFSRCDSELPMSDSKYAILGDIHANLEALDAVLLDANGQGITHYACVGDVVGYNANPLECIEKVREMGFDCVRGNHDHYCSSSSDEDLSSFHPLAAAVIAWTSERLSDDQRLWLKRLRYRKVIENFMIVHATLDMPEKWAYMFDDLDAMTNFSYQITPVCFHGHTHMPITFEFTGRVKTLTSSSLTLERGRKYFINVGSVGQPRDGDPRAAYAIYDAKDRTVEIRRVEYDIETAQARIIEAGLPTWLAERLAIGK